MKQLVVLLVLAGVVCCLSAQADSSFVSIYPLDQDLSYFWSLDYCYAQAANVLEAWDGRLLIQSSILVDTDPPPGSGALSYYSPFISFGRRGVYNSTSPYGYNGCSYRFTSVVKADFERYLGLNDSFSVPDMVWLDSNFLGSDPFNLYLDNGQQIRISDMIEASPSFIVTGEVGEWPQKRQIIAKFDFNCQELWHRGYFNSDNFSSHKAMRTTDGGYVSCFGNKILKVSATGD
ncbi:MAG: hypothetical protein RBS43_10145, partial [Candidatus Cloacimonas sp.]|nr:hypothetical protein [Candidatus Cloacimonas sp.]